MSPILTGEKAAGMAIEARMASGSRPLWKSTSELSMMLVATQAKGMRRSRVKSSESVKPVQSCWNSSARFLPLMNPPAFTSGLPIVRPVLYTYVFCFRRSLRLCRRRSSRSLMT